MPDCVRDRVEKKVHEIIIFPFEEFAAHFTRDVTPVPLFSRAESALNQAIKINESRKRSPGSTTEKKTDFFF